MSSNQDETLEGQLTVEDILSVEQQPEAQYRTLLEIWREVLSNADTIQSERITPQWANRIIGQYQGIGFADMPAFRDQYFGAVKDLSQILDAIIENDTTEALNALDAEEDGARNALLYKAVLFDWQRCFLTWELEWDCTDPQAGIRLGVVSEVHKMFFGPTGLVELLDQIGFQFTEDDQRELAQELSELIEAADGGSRE